MKKVELFGVIMALVGFVAISFGVSYSYLSYDETISEVSLTTGQMQIAFSNSTNTIENVQVPLSDELGKMLPYYLDFTVSGTVDLEEIYYEIYVLPDDNNTIAGKYIKFFLTNQNDEPITGAIPYDRLANSQSGNGKRLYGESVRKTYNGAATNFSTNYRLRVWVSDKYSEVTSKSFNFSVYLYAKNIKMNYMLPSFPQEIENEKANITHVYFEDEEEEKILEEYSTIANNMKFDLTDSTSYAPTGNVYGWLVDDPDDLGKYILYIKSEGIIYTTNWESRFLNYTSLISIDFGNFSTEMCYSFNNIFYGCSSLIELDFSTLLTYHLIGLWQAFYDCISLKKIDFTGVSTINCTSLSSTFYNCTSLVDIDLTGFATDNVTALYSTFRACESLEHLDLSSFRTLKVNNMQDTFRDCTSLVSLDLSNFHTPLVTIMYEMFYNCSSLVSLDLSSFYNGTSLTNIQAMFMYCSSLESINLENFNTINVTKMYALFYGCESLQELDLSNFRTDNVQDINSMFYGCSNLTELDLSSFNVTNTLTDCRSMFALCTNLKKIYVSANWNFTNVSSNNGSNMFNGCYAVVGGANTSFTWDGNSYAYAHIDEGQTNPGFFTDIADKV